MTTDVLIGRPNSPPALGCVLSNYANNQRLRDVRFVFAYISLSGLRKCLDPPMAVPAFSDAQKYWLVGLHHGITEPTALEELANTPRTEVKIFLPDQELKVATLRDSRKLHAKTVQIRAVDQDMLIVGSFNLTSAALGNACSNYEAGLAAEIPHLGVACPGYRNFNEWFDFLWQESCIATPVIINRYAQLRKRFIDTNPVITSELDQHPSETIATYNHLWIEAGAMSGGDRNQVEFGPRLARFFGPLHRGSTQLRIKYRQRVFTDRPFSFKQTRWGTEIWRFSLVTSGQGGPEYPHRIIHFTKQRNPEGIVFVLQVTDKESRNAKLWKMRSHREGTIAETGVGGKGRLYGVY